MMEKSRPLPGKRTIRIEPELDGQTLTLRVRCSSDLRKFFRKDAFFIRYEQPIDAPEAVLAVPGVALLLPLAWMTGSDIHVARLDRRFVESAADLQDAYRGMYPKIPFCTRLHVEETVDTPDNPEGTAMLFSGGLDATHTFFANRHLNPRLVQVFGTEFPLSNTQFLDLVKAETTAFADQHDVDTSFIYTDYFFFLDHRALIHAFTPVREKVNGDLWKGMGYALGFLSMCAPLSAGRFDHLLIAAWAPAERADRMRENPDASSPGIDQKIAWSNLRVEHHGCLHRYQKAAEMKDWLPGNQLRVCWLYEKALEVEKAMNCNRCEKCARTIVALALGGVDPESCGFVVDEDTVAYMKTRLIERKSKNSHMAMWWGPMQEAIPERIEGEMFGLAEFMGWFRDFDLGDGIDPPLPFFTVRRLFSLFPYPFALAVRSTIFGVLGEPFWANRPEED